MITLKELTTTQRDKDQLRGRNVTLTTDNFFFKLRNITLQFLFLKMTSWNLEI